MTPRPTSPFDEPRTLFVDLLTMWIALDYSARMPVCEDSCHASPRQQLADDDAPSLQVHTAPVFSEPVLYLQALQTRATTLFLRVPAIPVST